MITSETRNFYVPLGLDVCAKCVSIGILLTQSSLCTKLARVYCERPNVFC